MTTNLSFDDLASSLGISLPQAKREELHRRLELELSSIEPYPDAIEAISLLKASDVKTGISSNLSSPYGPKVREIFPHMDGYAFSYQVGTLKPDPGIYQSICAQMDVELGHCFGDELGRVLMIGDSQRCDRDGLRVVGISGFYVDRTGRGQIHDLVQFVRMVIDSNSPRP